MGKAHSKEPHSRPSHKLSKARVASFQKAVPAVPTSTPRPAVAMLSPSDPVPANDFKSIPYSATSSSSNYDADDSDESQHCDKSTPLAAPRAQRRISLFRSKSSQEDPDRRTYRRNTIIGSPILPSDGQFRAVARANSIAAHPTPDQSHRGLPLPPNENWPLPDYRASWAYDLSSYEAQRILRLVQDRDEPESNRRSQTSTSLADYTPEPMASRRASLCVQPQTAPISRSTSEISLHPPMRRRSMIQTPGVATRPRPPPTPARSRRSSIRHSHPPTPSMSRQPSTHFEDHFEESKNESDKHLSLPVLSAMLDISADLSTKKTPKDTDYSITGAYKFGTLRIMNGSPVRTSTPELCVHVQPKPTSTANDDFSEDVKRGAGAASDGPGVDELEDTQFLVADSAGCLNTGVGAAGEQRQPALSVSVSVRDVTGNASEPLLHLEMIQQRPVSPLMTQSRQAAVDDHLFDDDAAVSLPEVLDVRVDLNARSFPLDSTDSTQGPEGVNRSDSGFVSKSSSSQSRSSLAKADSGYSSNVSVRSLRSGKKLSSSKEETARSSAEADRPLREWQCTATEGQLEIKVPGPLSSIGDCSIRTPQSDKAPTPPPKDDCLLKQTYQNSQGTDNKRASATLITPGTKRGRLIHHRPARIDTSQNPESQEVMSPKELPLSPTSPTSPTSTTSDASCSSLTIGNNVQKPGRLQRFLSLKNSPFSKQPYTVHPTHSVDNQIPSIPSDVEAKLRERTGLYPMTTKRLTLKSQMSKDTLKTILSVGSLECVTDEHLPYTQTLVDQEDKADEESESGKILKYTFGTMQSNFKTAAASVMSTRRQISKKTVLAQGSQQTESETTGQEEIMLPLEEDMTSYLSIDSALGSDGYGAATRALPPAKYSRTMSMTTHHDHHSQFRTFSLPSVDGPTNTLSSPTGCPEAQMLPNRRTSPPISMVTRTGFRSPPPRSPVSPQGPAVLPRKSHERSSRPMSHSAALAAGHRLGRVPGGSRPSRPASMSQSHTIPWTPPSRNNSLSSQSPSLLHSRHSSTSSVSSDVGRDSRGHQFHNQHTTAAVLKHRYSLDTIGRSPYHGGHASVPAHQGPAFDRSNSSRSHNWAPTASHSMNVGQQPWAAPPHVPPRHHFRNASAGYSPNHPHAGSGQPPYRILHSYNSPAYRNAPIWG